jgi:RNA polymerase sigma-70 factor (ECF subfamily)
MIKLNAETLKQQEQRTGQKDSPALWHETQSAADQDLVCRCNAGEESAFEELVSKYQQSLFNIVYRHIGDPVEVEDIVQKIFTKIYFSLAKFDNERPFFPWLYRIAINQCYDELRRIRRRKVLRFADLDLPDPHSVEFLVNKTQRDGHKEKENGQDMHALLYRTLDRLPDKQRRIIVLRDLEQMPYEHIAELLECTEQAARLKVFRARTKLRNLMLKEMNKQPIPMETRTWQSEPATA